MTKGMKTGERLYSIAELARATGYAYNTICARVRVNTVPEPDVKYGRREYYSEGLFKKIVKANG